MSCEFETFSSSQHKPLHAQDYILSPFSGITIGLEIGLLSKITCCSLLKVPFRTDLQMKTV